MAAGIFGQKSNGMAEKMVSEMIAMTLKAISMGMGFYISLVVAIFLGFVGVKKFLASTASV